MAMDGGLCCEERHLYRSRSRVDLVEDGEIIFTIHFQSGVHQYLSARNLYPFPIGVSPQIRINLAIDGSRGCAQWIVRGALSTTSLESIPCDVEWKFRCSSP